MQPILITCGLTGLLFAISGYILYRFPPKKRNWWYGYRTAASQKSQEHWDFAQKFSGKLVALWGLVLLALGLFGSLFELPVLLAILSGLFLPLAVCIHLFVATERALREKFPEDS
ncbi:SdpI/YhfL protein family protein [Robiginitalea myxolifaciens]|uniref:SdpI/YhfL protein family protein n=1 Tax=Robiginitalea myxolifaciens TaxID=400055 RepID=A0A1I6FP18_9FLAO|nr:SdpI family protein [Robiginitalea myxolifaciens]SFR31648.1 SdpI/YhfL protein family protein [Robiginitalea myxolifaciens]